MAQENYEELLRIYVNDVLGVNIGKGKLIESLKDGTYLCQLVNAVKPNTIPESKIKKPTNPNFCRNNIEVYLKTCKSWGMTESELFETRDLYDGQRPQSVINNLCALTYLVKEAPINYDKAPVGPGRVNPNPRDFSEEVLAKGKAVVPLASQGALQQDLSSKHDSYGIIKNKDVTKHTGVQSTWEKGSLEQDISSKHDSYGIVKNKDVTKHTGVQSTWEKGSLEQDISSKHDSYGIIKNKDVTKHTGVQSTWEKGSLEQDVSSKHDSYGVVKQPDNLKK